MPDNIDGSEIVDNPFIDFDTAGNLPVRVPDDPEHTLPMRMPRFRVRDMMDAYTTLTDEHVLSAMDDVVVVTRSASTSEPKTKSKKTAVTYHIQAVLRQLIESDPSIVKGCIYKYLRPEFKNLCLIKVENNSKRRFSDSTYYVIAKPRDEANLLIATGDELTIDDLANNFEFSGSQNGLLQSSFIDAAQLSEEPYAIRALLGFWQLLEFIEETRGIITQNVEALLNLNTRENGQIELYTAAFRDLRLMLNPYGGFT
jgi:hypothetical protein